MRKGFRRNEDGSPALEFALVAPVLMLLVIGIIEFGTIMFVNVLMEGSLRDASRFGLTGQIEDPTERVNRIIDLIADRTIGLVNINEANITIESYPSFDDIGQAEAYVDGNKNGRYNSGETYKDCNGNRAVQR